MNQIIQAHELESPFSVIPTVLVKKFYEEVLGDYEDLCDFAKGRHDATFPIDPSLEGDGLFYFFMDDVMGQRVEQNYQEWVLNGLDPGASAEEEAEIESDCRSNEYNSDRWYLMRDVEFAMLYLRLSFITEIDVWLRLGRSWEDQFLHTSQYMEHGGFRIWNPPHRGVW